MAILDERELPGRLLDGPPSQVALHSGLLEGCEGCRGSGRVDQTQITPPDLPTVAYRLVAPSLQRPVWFETQDDLLDWVDAGTFTTTDAVVHKLWLDQPGRGHKWTRLYYHPPRVRGSYLAHPFDPQDP